MQITLTVADYDGDTITETVVLDRSVWERFTLQEATILEEELGPDTYRTLFGPESDETAASAALIEALAQSPRVLRAALYAKVWTAASPRIRPHLTIEDFDLPLDAASGAELFNSRK